MVKKMAQQPRASYIAMLVLGMLFTGSMNTIAVNMQLKMKSIGVDGTSKTFKKPWFATFDMMFAMMLVIFVDMLVGRCSRSKQAMIDAGPQSSPAQPMLDAGPQSRKPEKQLPYWKRVCMVSTGAFFDLLATALSSIGLSYIPASVWQMLKGSSLLFTGVFSVMFLNRKLLNFNIMGLLLCFIGVTVVGLASVLGSSARESDAPNSQPIGMVIFGMSMVLVGQVVQAAQVIAEEWLMKDLNLPALQVIGWEGIWGVLMMVAAVYPILYVLPGADDGHMEDVFDTGTMLMNSKPLQYCVIAYLFSCSTFNITGVLITKELSATHRQMMDASRTLVIWLFDLGVHYLWDKSSPFGEEITAYSALQLLGFVILALGQMTYGEIISWPCVKPPEPDMWALRSPMPSPSRC